MALIMKYIDSMHHYMDKYGGKLASHTLIHIHQAKAYLLERRFLLQVALYVLYKMKTSSL